MKTAVSGWRGVEIKARDRVEGEGGRLVVEEMLGGLT